LGDREMSARQVAVRTQKGEDLGAMSLDSFLTKLSKEIENKS